MQNTSIHLPQNGPPLATTGREFSGKARSSLKPGNKAFDALQVGSTWWFLRTHGVDMTIENGDINNWNCQLSGKVGKPSAISYRPYEGHFSDAIYCWIIWRDFRGHFIRSFRSFGFRSIWTWAFFPNIDQRFAKQRWRWHFGPPLYTVRDFSICALSKFYIMTYHDEPLDLIPKFFFFFEKEPEFYHYGSSILHFFSHFLVFFLFGGWDSVGKKHLSDAFRR